MLQYMLLFLEITLLVATVYIYWTTRRLVEEAEKNTAVSPPPEPGWVQNQATVTQMAQDVTTLMAELQTVAEAARDDVVQKTAHLQQLIGRADTAIAEIRELMAQLETKATAPEKATAAASQPAAVAEDEPLVPIKLVYSPSYFGEYLRLSGCGKEVVEVATTHAQEFIFWFTNQFENELPTRIENSHLEDYVRYMEAQRHDLDTIKRRYIALKAYMNWANNISQPDGSAAKPAPAAPIPSPAEIEANHQASAILRSQKAPDKTALPAAAPKPEPEETPSNLERYRTVFALAEQGLDQLAIAARTGLEQEAVRMLLVIGKSAYAGL